MKTHCEVKEGDVEINSLVWCESANTHPRCVECNYRKPEELDKHKLDHLLAKAREE